MTSAKVTPNLWFDTQGQEAAEFYVSVPAALNELVNDPDSGRAQRAMQAMLGMKKLDVAALYAAADQA